MPHTTLDLASYFPAFPTLCSFFPSALPGGAEQAGAGWSSPHKGRGQPSTFTGPQFSCPHNSCAEPEGHTDPPRANAGERLSQILPQSSWAIPVQDTAHTIPCPAPFPVRDPAWPSEWRQEEVGAEAGTTSGTITDNRADSPNYTFSSS